MGQECSGKYSDMGKLGHKILFNIYSAQKPFPLNDEEYYDSTWCQWIERIQEGQRHEQERIQEWVDQCGDVECFVEDFLIAEEVSEIMYAALTVAIWSNIESFIKETISMCETILKQKSTNLDEIRRMNIVKCDKYLNSNINVNLRSLQCYDFVNAVRIISNCFKHNNGRYIEKSNNEKDKIEEALKTKWDLECKQRIVYRKINFYELIINCGLFCDNLKREFKKIKTCNPV